MIQQATFCKSQYKSLILSIDYNPLKQDEIKFSIKIGSNDQANLPIMHTNSILIGQQLNSKNSQLISYFSPKFQTDSYKYQKRQQIEENFKNFFQKIFKKDDYQIIANTTQQSQYQQNSNSQAADRTNDQPRQVDGIRYLKGRPTDLVTQLHSQYSTSKFILSHNGRLRIQVREIFPSFLVPRYNELKISYHGTDFKVVIFENKKPLPQYRDVLRVNIEEDDKSYSMLIVKFTLQLGQSIEITLPLEKQFKQFEQFPNDPQRGHDIMPSLIRYGPHVEGDEMEFEDSTLVESNALLVFINQPDFSMPFNVIAVTSGVIGFLFIQMFNIVMSTGTKSQELNNMNFDGFD